MTEFDRIIANEKSREYQMQDKDQFAFDTLTAIQNQRSKSLKRALIILFAVIAVLAVGVQFLFLQTASFSELTASIKDVLAQKPYYLALFNLAFVAVILAFRRLRVF